MSTHQVKALGIVHTFLLASFVPLFLFAQNRGQASAAEVVLPLALVLTVNAVVHLLVWRSRVDHNRASIVISGTWLAFFLFLPAIQLTEWRIRHVFVVFLLLGSGVAAVAWKASAHSIRRATQVMAIVAILLSLNPARVLIVEALRDARVVRPTPPSRSSMAPAHGRPDIFYLILDGYTSSASLKRYFDYDNSEFENYLRSKGFYIASNSRSNYASTINSVASSLNMEHAATWGDTDPVRVRRRIHNSRVFRELRRVGYRITFITMSSHLRSDRATPLIDDHLAFGGISDLSQYQMTLLGLTPVRLMRIQAERTPLRGLAGRMDRDGKVWRPEGLDWVLDKMAQQPRESPAFVFVHVLSPHSPFYHDADCNVVSAYAEGSWNNFDRDFEEYRRAYVAQVACLNRKVTRTLDTLLSHASAEQPIVIIQADHGAPEILDRPLLQRDPPTDIGDFRFSILNAYRVPEHIREKLYDTITPVNSFRVVLEGLFDVRLPLLPDVNFWLRNGTYVPVLQSSVAPQSQRRVIR